MLADTAGRWPLLDEDTSDFRYVRLHGDAKGFAPWDATGLLERLR